MSYRRRVILLRAGRQPKAFIEYECGLFEGFLTLFRFRDGRNEIRPAAALDNLLRRLPARVDPPMA